jgi:virginiamycin B lyase
MRHALPRTFRSSRSGLGLAGALLAAVFVAGCGGSGGTVPSAPSGNTAQQQQMASVTFTMRWNTSGTSATKRAPQYIGAASSIGVTINGAVPQYLNAPVTSMSLNAPVGTDTFTFISYDQANGSGNVLGVATVTKQIILGTTNTISAVLNGIVASYTLSIANPSPPAGVAVDDELLINAYDADGNLIFGTGSNYAQPITLSIFDPKNTGQLTLSATSVKARSTIIKVHYAGGTLASASVVATAPGLPGAAAAFAPTPTFYQFSIPTSTNRPGWITAGSDGNMWFTENPGGKVARITPAGVVTEFTVPTANAQPQMIIGGSDGNLWFAEFATTPSPGSSKIARLTTTGTFTEFSTLFSPPPPDNPLGLIDRGDGNVWYVANGSSRVGFQGITSGVAGETSIPTASSYPFGIATAPDNNLYYTESATDKIGRIANLFTTQSEISLTTGTVPESIVRGPDGNLWFTENGTSKIGRLSPNSFSVTGEFPTLTANAQPAGIVVGKDGAMWFTENGLDKIGRITTGGTVTEYASPVTGLGLLGIAVAPDGSLWFCEPGTGLNPGRVGKLVY